MIKVENEFIKNYHNFFPTKGKKLSFFNKLISSCQNKPASLLSLEGGDLFFEQKLAKKNCQITAIDSVPEFITAAKANNKIAEKITLSSFPMMDIGRYLKKASFDTIFCLNSRLIFMPSKALLTKFFFDVKYLLKENGTLVLELANLEQFDLKKQSVTLSSFPKKQKLDISVSQMDLNFYLNVAIPAKNDEEITIVENHPVFPFTKKVIEAAAAETQFSSVEFYSSYGRKPFEPKSHHLICVLRK